MTVLSKNRHDNARPGQQAALEIPGGKIACPPVAPLKETLVGGEVAGPLASLTLTQEFDCSFVPENRTVEAVYCFPLPGDGLVMGVSVLFGETRIQTELAERKAAEKEYSDAKNSGRQAALLTQESEDAFMLRITGISGTEPVRVETEFLLWLPPTEDGFSLRIPLTLAPRYSRRDEAGSKKANGQPLDVKWDPGHRARLSLVCRGFRSVECSSNALRVNEDTDGSLLVSFEEESVFPDQDIVLTLISACPVQNQPGLNVFSAPDGTFLALAVPPAAEPEKRMPREILLLVDHSGSMEGPKWEAADWAVETFISRLEPSDRFNLGFFHTTCRWISSSPLEASKENIRRAEDFIHNSTDSGGTELGMSLEQALSQHRIAGEHSRHVLVFTDGQVTDINRISLLLEREAEKADARRISIICIDSAPNEPLASMVAEKGRGICAFLSSNPDDVDITTALENVLKEFARPLAVGTALSASVPLRDAAGIRTNENETLDLGDLTAERPRWVCGRFEGSPEELRLVDGKGVLIASALPSQSSQRTAEAVRSLWSSLRIRRLESLFEAEPYIEENDFLKALGLLGASPEKKARPLYGQRASLHEHIRETVVRESLESGVLCSETAFFAVREEEGKKISGTMVVTNALPRGWSDMSAPQRMMSCSYPDPSQSSRASLQNIRNVLRKGPSDGAPDRMMSESLAFSAHRIEASRTIELFRGILSRPVQGKTILFSGRAGEGKLKNTASLSGIGAVPIDGTLPDTAGTAEVRILVNGAVMASVLLADLLAKDKKRPLNIRLRKGDTITVEVAGQPGEGKYAFTLELIAEPG